MSFLKSAIEVDKITASILEDLCGGIIGEREFLIACLPEKMGGLGMYGMKMLVQYAFESNHRKSLSEEERSKMHLGSWEAEKVFRDQQLRKDLGQDEKLDRHLTLSSQNSQWLSAIGFSWNEKDFKNALRFRLAARKKDCDAKILCGNCGLLLTPESADHHFATCNPSMHYDVRDGLIAVYQNCGAKSSRKEPIYGRRKIKGRHYGPDIRTEFWRQRTLDIDVTSISFCAGTNLKVSVESLVKTRKTKKNDTYKEEADRQKAPEHLFEQQTCFS